MAKETGWKFYAPLAGLGTKTSHSILKVLFLPIHQLEVKDYRDFKVGRVTRRKEPRSLITLKATHLNTHITLLYEEEINFYSIKILFIIIAITMLTKTRIITGLKLAWWVLRIEKAPWCHTTGQKLDTKGEKEQVLLIGNLCLKLKKIIRIKDTNDHLDQNGFYGSFNSINLPVGKWIPSTFQINGLFYTCKEFQQLFYFW